MPNVENIKFDVTNRWTGNVQFTAEIKCRKDEVTSVKLGLAVKWALKSGAGLRGADLRGAKGAETAIAQTRILPEGNLIGWKKCRGSVIVKLRIPEEAKRSHAFGRKCRAEFADVLEIIGADEARSSRDPDLVYRVGERVTPDHWCDDWQTECSSGIHFFITRLEAEAY